MSHLAASLIADDTLCERVALLPMMRFIAIFPKQHINYQRVFFCNCSDIIVPHRRENLCFQLVRRSTFTVSQGVLNEMHYFLYKYLYSLTMKNSKMSKNRPISKKNLFRIKNPTKLHKIDLFSWHSSSKGGGYVNGWSKPASLLGWSKERERRQQLQGTNWWRYADNRQLLTETDYCKALRK